MYAGGEFRLGLQDLAGELDPVFEPALLAVDGRQAEQRAEILFLEHQDLRVSCRGFGQFAVSMQELGFLHQE